MKKSIILDLLKWTKVVSQSRETNEGFKLAIPTRLRVGVDPLDLKVASGLVDILFE